MVKLEENREKKPRINRKVELMLEEIVDTEKKIRNNVKCYC